MSALLQPSWTNLRTIIVFFAVVVIPIRPLCSQPTISPLHALAETDARVSPLCAIRPELSLDVLPIPFGHATLSQIQAAYGMPQYHSSLFAALQGAPGILHSVVSARTHWRPREDYLLALQTSAEWYAVSFFPDQWSCGIDIAASMRLVDWHISSGIIDAVVWGRPSQPQFMLGISQKFSSGAVSFEMASSWRSRLRSTISATYDVTDSVSALVRLQASPIGVEFAVRFPVSQSMHVVLGIKQRELIGLQQRISLCWY
jgi:hypothetical protein